MNDKNTKEKKVFSDYEIFQGKVSLIHDDGTKEVIDRDAAIEMAHEKGMNLIQVAYNKDSYPRAIVKMKNIGKMKYEMKKKEKERIRKSRIANAEAKEVDFSIRIDDGDKKTKINHIRKFIDDKTKVRIVIKLSRREQNLGKMAKDLMVSIFNAIQDISEPDGQVSFVNGIMSCTVKPKSKMISKILTYLTNNVWLISDGLLLTIMIYLWLITQL